MEAQGQAGPDPSALIERYRRLTPTLEKLRSESEWELKHAIETSGIKLHSFTSRVKTESSFLEKLKRKGYSDPWSQTEDLVGLRAVCLFRTDIHRLEEVARSCFSVISQHDTVERGNTDTDDPETFGYMSVHLNARIHPHRAGPRYDDIKELTFEVQLRTILMDAWANVSTYLDYKGASSIPSPLRRDFYALSGLFYVADKHFELFFEQSRSRRTETVAELRFESPDLNVELNLDTLLGFLAARFPDREHSNPSAVSELVEELVEAGYTTLAAVADTYERAEQAALAYEAKYRPGTPADSGPRRFWDVGILRSGLTIADPAVAQIRTQRGTMPPSGMYEEFANLVRPPA